MIIRNANLSSQDTIDSRLIDLAYDRDKQTKITVTLGYPRHNCGTYYRQTCKFYDDCYGKWYLFGGYCLDYALIRADSFQSAYDIYLEQFVPDDNVEYIDECKRLNFGSSRIDTDPPIEPEGYYFDDCGNAYHETTTSYIVALRLSDNDIEIELTDDTE